MRKLEKWSQVRDAVRATIVRSTSVEELARSLREVLGQALSATPAANPFLVELIRTESLHGVVYYQSSKRSEKAIQITHAGASKYVWKEYNEWCLDDRFDTPSEIADALLSFDVVTKIPENARELFEALRECRWRLEPASMPKFGGTAPKDSREVVSWDENYVLCGTSIENLRVMARGDWDSLCERENAWFS